jgi:hypothetical protein
MSNQPTVFHITHWKAGSQWVAEVLKHCAPDRFVPQKIRIGQFLEDSIKPGGVYPSVYVPRSLFRLALSPSGCFDRRVYKDLQEFPWSALIGEAHRRASLFRRYKFFLPPYPINWLNFQVIRKPFIKFVVIRDLRDTLVSLYFSLKVSHPVLNKRIRSIRDILNSVDKDEGLIYLMDGVINQISEIQMSWLGDPLFIRYEDLLADEHTVFGQIIDHCQIDVSLRRLHEIVKYNSFEAATGRKRGEEDVTAHLRKGIAGDWRNHFSDHVKEEFKKRFGDALINTGYESDSNW